MNKEALYRLYLHGCLVNDVDLYAEQVMELVEQTGVSELAAITVLTLGYISDKLYTPEGVIECATAVEEQLNE